MRIFNKEKGAFILKHKEEQLLYFYIQLSHKDLCKALPLSHPPPSSTYLFAIFQMHEQKYITDYLGHGTLTTLLQTIQSTKCANIECCFEECHEKTGIEKELFDRFWEMYQSPIFDVPESGL